MDKLLPTIADMPNTDREVVDLLITDLARLTRELFGEQLKHVSDTELRQALIQLMEYGYFKVDTDGDLVQWHLFQISSQSWLHLPPTRYRQE